MAKSNQTRINRAYQRGQAELQQRGGIAIRGRRRSVLHSFSRTFGQGIDWRPKHYNSQHKHPGHPSSQKNRVMANKKFIYGRDIAKALNAKFADDNRKVIDVIETEHGSVRISTK
jgi:hypothetical protein